MERLTDGLKKILLAGIGTVAVTAEKSKEVLDEMVKRGELTVEQGKVLNEELKHNLKDAIRDNVTVSVVRPDVMDAVDNMTDAELEALKARIHAAEARRSAEEKTEEGTGEAPEAEATEETNETESK